MDGISVLIILSLVIYIINVVPVFMPPTWTILAFYYLQFHPPLLPAAIAGAVAATLGRVTLYYISKNHFRRFFSKKDLANYDSLGQFFKKRQKLSAQLFLTYAFFPVSSNYVYIAAGLSKINIKLLAGCFLLGRIFSYTFWVATSHVVFTRIDQIFSKELSNTGVIILEIIGLIIIIAIGKINWKKVIRVN